MNLNALTISTILGPVISLAVSGAKRIPVVKNNPKAVAFILSAVIGGIQAIHGTPASGAMGPLDIAQLILIPFAGAVATHEAVVDPATKRFL